MKNVKALIEYRLKGRAIIVGEVIAKSDFAVKGDWQNLVHMTPARVEETSDPVAKAPKAPKAPKATKPAMPGSVK